MHDQLQDILNKCIEKGWKPRGSENIIRIEYRQYNDYNAEFRMVKNGSLGEVGYIVGTHDLLSKDSGLMEFVKWQYKPMEYIYIKDMDMDYHYICNKAEYTYHSMIMGPMTAKEKVKYFIDNVII